MNFEFLFKILKMSLTLIMVTCVWSVNYYLLYRTLREKKKEISLEEYLIRSLKIQFVPILFMFCIILPICLLLIYLLYTYGETLKISTLLFLIFLISSFFNLAKSIAIIYNNYDKSKVSNYQTVSDVTSRVDTIYKALITKKEYSNIDTFIDIWTFPIIISILTLIFTLISNKVVDPNTSSNMNINDITIGDILQIFKVIISNAKIAYKMSRISDKLGNNAIDKIITEMNKYKYLNDIKK